MLTSYKYGWKTVYYQNTYDSKTEDEVLTEEVVTPIDDDEDCDACAI